MSTRDGSVSICRLSTSFDALMSDRNDSTLGSTREGRHVCQTENAFGPRIFKWLVQSDEGGSSLIRSESGSVGVEEGGTVLLADACEFNVSNRRPERMGKMSIPRREDKNGNLCVPLGKVVPEGRARICRDSCQEVVRLGASSNKQKA
jgi:hypothetical protein